MKIDKIVLQGFLENILLKGDRCNKECKLVVELKDISVQLLSGDNTTAIRGKLKGDFEKIGELGIDSLEFLVSVVKTFKDGEIKIEKKANKIVLTQKKQKATLILRDTQYIKNTLENERLAKLETKEKDYFVLNSEIVKEIVSFLNSYKSKTIKINGEEKEINILIENNENTFEKIYDIDNTIPKFAITLGSPFIDVISSVGQDLTVKVPTGRAFQCSIKDENKEVEYFIAMVREEK